MDPQDEETRRRLARAFVWTGVATIVLGVVLGAVVWAPLFAIAALSVVDFVLAWAYSTGRMKGASGGSAVEADPDYNPYARED